MIVGFVGLGNVGAKLAGSLLDGSSCGRPDGEDEDDVHIELLVHDLDPGAMEPLAERGAEAVPTLDALAPRCDVIITCLPSPAVCAEVAESMLPLMPADGLWMEISTTDEAAIRRLGPLAAEHGVTLVECPVSGGCHRAATGNISIFVGGSRDGFDRAFPLLAVLGGRILHTGPWGSASVLKVITNYLAAVHLTATGEAFAVARAAGMDMATTYHAIAISSGNSFSHETEGQLILNGSYDINFTMDLVEKDADLFLGVAGATGVTLELAPVVREVFADARRRYGGRALSPRVVQRFEDDLGFDFRAPGFPAELVDGEPRRPGHEVVDAVNPME